MSTPFGPRLIGETEKTLNAVLARTLDGRLSEPGWVTLRVADLLGDTIEGDEALAAAVLDRAHFADAVSLVAALVDAGLLHAGRLTTAGHALLTELQSRIDEATRLIWRDLPAADVEATERVLNEVVLRARAALA